MTVSSIAALLQEPGVVALDTIEFEAPGPGQVLLRTVAAGICHTDLHIRDSTDGWGRSFPMLLGHEGAGIIEAVGPDVLTLSPGDRVAIGCRVPCGVCAQCRRGNPRRCATSAPGAPRLFRAGDRVPVTAAFGVGLFAERIIVDAGAAVRVEAGVPLEHAAMFGCALMTGVGAVMNTAKVFPGATVAVVGCGGIGLSVVQGARLAHASRIVAIDVSAAKLQWALELGATDVVDSSAVDPVQAVFDLTGGLGVDFAFEAVGLSGCVDQCLRMLGYAGVATIIGVPHDGRPLELGLGGPDGFFSRTKSLLVTHGGDSLPQQDLPVLGQLAMQGMLSMERMVTHRVGLEDLETGFDLMRASKSIRTVVSFGDGNEVG